MTRPASPTRSSWSNWTRAPSDARRGATSASSSRVPLDEGSGAPLRGDEVVCTNHGATFDLDTGLCTHGPCEGAYLAAVEARVADGAVYLDAAYEYLGRGPVEDDDRFTSPLGF